MPTDFIKVYAKELLLLSILALGVVSYVPPYLLILDEFDRQSELPFVECADFFASVLATEAVFTMHPELLEKYYSGPLYMIPVDAGFTELLREAGRKEVKYLIIDSTSVMSLDLTALYYYSVYPEYRPPQIPLEFNLIKANKWKYGLYIIQSESWFKAAIFSDYPTVSTMWENTLGLMGASTSIFSNVTDISEIDLSEFDVVIFADFLRILGDSERLYLEELVKNGLNLIVSGLSPYYLAGGTENLTSISTWFGATRFSEVTGDERWNVRFTEDATEIMKELTLELEYKFYSDSDWSTPISCTVQPKSIVYAYRVNDDTSTIFLHKFERGTSIFFGPRLQYAFDSQDRETLKIFLKSFIQYLLI